LEAAERRSQSNLANFTAAKAVGEAEQDVKLKGLHEIIAALKKELGEKRAGNTTLSFTTSQTTRMAVSNQTAARNATTNAAVSTTTSNSTSPIPAPQSRPEPSPSHSNPLQQMGVPPQSPATVLPPPLNPEERERAEQQLPHELKAGQGNFLAARQPGGRMKLEEAKARVEAEEEAGRKGEGESPSLIGKMAKLDGGEGDEGVDQREVDQVVDGENDGGAPAGGGIDGA